MKISVMLTTIGRPCLSHMLESLIDELSTNDFLYIFIDGSENVSSTVDIFKMFKDRFVCNTQIIVEPDKIGFWGHAIRNKYQKQLQGDFIIHADDDDVFIKNSFTIIRNSINDINNKDKIYFFKFYDNFKKNSSVWKIPKLSLNNIGTPCGVIPNIPEKFGEWGYRYGGDFDFYNSCKFETLIFVDEIIYCVKPFDHGFYVK
jgi:hypothetical protein